MKTKTYEGNLDWQMIQQDAKDYKYVVMYRDHYRGNGKGEWFNAEDFAILYEQQGFWFYNCERPVSQVILTDDDVPAIINQRREIIRNIEKVECDIRYTNIPSHPLCDGRATRRTQPEAFAAWDKARAKATRRLRALRSRRDKFQAELDAVQPNYSTTLYNIKLDVNKYIFGIDGVGYEVSLTKGGTKKLEYKKGRYAKVSVFKITREATKDSIGSAFLRVEFDNGNIWPSKDAVIAKRMN